MVTESQQALRDAIDRKIGEVRSESIDLTFGELISLKEKNELVIDPEYQRLFRWTDGQRSRLIESLLLRLPIPPVFMMENDDGRYELIDGLQRISSVYQFIEPSLIGETPLTLVDCDIVPELNSLKYDDLPIVLRMQLKRTVVRAIVINRQSKSFLRYEMFKRLNTGGSELSGQEIRNCSVRLLGTDGVQFYDFISELSRCDPFTQTTGTLSEADAEKRGHEELVLRFFAAKDGTEFYHGNVRDWLDSFLEAIILKRVNFDFDSQRLLFLRTFSAVKEKIGPYAFVKHANGSPVGGLAPAYFEAVSVGVSRTIEKFETLDLLRAHATIVGVFQSNEFRQSVGAGANKKSKLESRVSLIESAISGIHQ